MEITHMDIGFVENLKDDYCDYKEYERASLEKLLSRVKESDRQKARELLNDSLNNGFIRLLFVKFVELDYTCFYE